MYFCSVREFIAIDAMMYVNKRQQTILGIFCVNNRYLEPQVTSQNQ